jgi:hypothetical protein
MKIKIPFVINGNVGVFRHFSTGQSFCSHFLISDKSLYRWKNSDKVFDVLWSRLSLKCLTVQDYDRFLNIAIKFKDKWNFSNNISCIGGMHIHIKYLPKAGSMFYSYRLFL